jgi:predicted enzyme related to lactoylglutathione lyase
MSQFQNVNVAYHYVKDWERAKKFYDEVLGWPVAYSDDNIGWREYGMDNATHIAIQKSTEGDQGNPGVGSTITFLVENVDKTQAWLKSKGVKVDEVIVIPGVIKFGTFFDPEGNRMQFVEPQPPPA